MTRPNDPLPRPATSRGTAFLAALTLILGLASTASAAAPRSTATAAPSHAARTAATVPVPAPRFATLDDRQIDGLLVALDQEYRLAAIYQVAIQEFGGETTFIAAQRVQDDRLGRLRQAYQGHGLSFPANPWSQRITPFASPEQACLVAYRAELELDGTLAHLATADDPALSTTYRLARESGRGSWIDELRSCALKAVV